MPPLNNSKWEKFCLNYFEGKSGKESTIIAGYKPSRAYQTVSRLLRDGNILERLQKLQQAAASAKIASVRECKEKLTEIIRACMSDFVKVNANGVQIIIDPVESAHHAGLQDVRSWTKYDDNGISKVTVTTIKLHDSIKAIAELTKKERFYTQVTIR